MNDFAGNGRAIERQRTLGGWIVFAQAFLDDDRFEQELSIARDRGCHIDYAIALANARDVYRGYLAAGSVN